MAKNSSLKTLLKAAVKIEVQRCSIKGVRPATLLKKRLWHRCFPVNFAKFLRTSFIIDHLWSLLLSLYINCWITSRQESFNEDSIACSVKHQLWNLRVKSLSCVRVKGFTYVVVLQISRLNLCSMIWYWCSVCVKKYFWTRISCKLEKGLSSYTSIFDGILDPTTNPTNLPHPTPPYIHYPIWNLFH